MVTSSSKICCKYRDIDTPKNHHLCILCMLNRLQITDFPSTSIHHTSYHISAWKVKKMCWKFSQACISLFKYVSWKIQVLSFEKSYTYLKSQANGLEVFPKQVHNYSSTFLERIKYFFENPRVCLYLLLHYYINAIDLSRYVIMNSESI